VASIGEGPQHPTALRGALRDGLEVLDLGQEIEFQSYSRVVLPIDGYVFWQPGVKCTFKGSLHYSQEMLQLDDETRGLVTGTFTSEHKIVEFEAVPVDRIWITNCAPPMDTAAVDGGPVAQTGVRLAFSQQQGFYTQAGLWHYFGHNVTPALASQLLDRPGAIDPKRAITSNSLALWLALNSYTSPFYDYFQRLPGFLLYPSKLVPTNLQPPYGVVQIDPSWTRALQAVPYIDINRNHYQLAADRARVILYGLQNDEACDFLDLVLQYSAETDNFGLMNTPLIADGKREQVEIMTIAMQKFIDFEVSYYQIRVAQVARQLLLNALPIQFIIESGTL
jgi:hypothetical protein